MDHLQEQVEAQDGTLKVCCMCGLDVTSARRVRDASDRYWCESCVPLQTPQRHAPDAIICPDCGDVGVELVEQDAMRVCAACQRIRQIEIADAKLRRDQKGDDPEHEIRRSLRLLAVAWLGFATLMVVRHTALGLKFEQRFDDWLNVVMLILPMLGVVGLYVAISVRRRLRLRAYDQLLEQVENGILALAEKQNHNQTQSVIERTEGLRLRAKRAIRRIESAAGRGIERADKIIEQFHVRHDTASMVSFLSDQRPRTHDLVARNREIETLAYLNGDYETAASAIRAVLMRIPSELDASTRQAMILCATGDLDRAKKIFVRIINLAEKQDDLLAEADGYANLGLVHQLLDQIDDAHKFHNKALFMYKKLPGNEDREADCYGNIGFIHHRRGENRDAELVFRKALEINTRLGRIEGMALDYGVLGLMVYNSPDGKLSESEKMLRRAVTLNDQIGRFGAVAAAYGNLGLVKAKNRDFKRARQMLLTALSIYQRLNRPKMVHKVQTMLTQLSKSAPAG